MQRPYPNARAYQNVTKQKMRMALTAVSAIRKRETIIINAKAIGP